MKHLLKISEFAYLSGIKRKNLIYYDEIGLLSPEKVKENGYRFYSYRQLETVSVIEALQEVGMSLSEIKKHLEQRTPTGLLELFTVQKKCVEEKIQRLERIQIMIETRLKVTQRALEIDPSKIELQNCSEEFLFVGEEIPCQNTEEAFEKALTAFYDLCDQEKITYGYPFGTMILRQNLLERNWRFPSRFFYKMPKKEGSRPRLSKPAGLYLMGFESVSYYEPRKIYTRMFDFMKKNGLSILGNSYEEFLLDEIAVKNSKAYLLQVSIQVKEI